MRIINDFDRAMRSNRDSIRHPVSYLVSRCSLLVLWCNFLYQVNMARSTANVDETQLDQLIPPGDRLKTLLQSVSLIINNLSVCSHQEETRYVIRHRYSSNQLAITTTIITQETSAQKTSIAASRTCSFRRLLKMCSARWTSLRGRWRAAAE
jgi:hypothetical protein